MAAGSRDSLLRQRHVYNDVADVRCNRTLPFRLVDNSTSIRIALVGCESEHIISYWTDLTIRPGELSIYTGVIMSCLNQCVADSLVLRIGASTSRLCFCGKVQKTSLVNSTAGQGKAILKLKCSEPS